MDPRYHDPQRFHGLAPCDCVPGGQVLLDQFLRPLQAPPDRRRYLSCVACGSAIITTAPPR